MTFQGDHETIDSTTSSEKHWLAVSQFCVSGSPQYPLGSAMVARPSRLLVQIASFSGCVGSRVTTSPSLLTFVAFSHSCRTFLSLRCSGGVGYWNCPNTCQGGVPGIGLRGGLADWLRRL